jgi:hypothetical protein
VLSTRPPQKVSAAPQDSCSFLWILEVIAICTIAAAVGALDIRQQEQQEAQLGFLVVKDPIGAYVFS